MSGEQAAHALAQRLGVTLDGELLVLALTHRSFAYENGGLPTNERLEFLGDAVLGVVVTDVLYRDHPEASEGTLAKMRAACVSQRALAEIARHIELGPCILLGKGESATGGHDKDSILCDAFEALLGAVYVAHGMEVSREVIGRLLGPSLTAAARSGAALDWKSSLQEKCAELGLGAPEYHVHGTGPDHARHFTARVVAGERELGHGAGSAKKHAEQAAAEQAYGVLVAEEST